MYMCVFVYEYGYGCMCLSLWFCLLCVIVRSVEETTGRNESRTLRISESRRRRQRSIRATVLARLVLPGHSLDGGEEGRREAAEEGGGAQASEDAAQRRCDGS